MKLSEAIAKLESVRTAQLEATLFGGKRAVLYYEEGYFMIDIYTDNGYKIDSWRADGAFNGNVRIDLDWQEPVTWQEALQAWARGKVVKARTDHRNYEFSPTARMELSPEMIWNAKWYVED